MKLLFDHHLSHKLVQRLADVFPDSTQTRLIGFGTADDNLIWEYAKQHGFEVALKAGGKASLGLYQEGKAQGHVTDAQVKAVLQARFQDRLAPGYGPDGCEAKDGARWIQFCQTVQGSLDGDAEAIRDWLVRATLDLVELGELLTQATAPDLRV
jgi:hypothetical protein